MTKIYEHFCPGCRIRFAWNPKKEDFSDAMNRAISYGFPHQMDLDSYTEEDVGLIEEYNEMLGITQEDD